MFDCVIQTRHSRSGIFYTSRGRIRITDSRYRSDFYSPDPSCQCYTCTHFTRAYLNHLFKIGDILSATLATIHNLTWFAQFMKTMRDSIIKGEFDAFRKEVHSNYPDTVNTRNDHKSKHSKDSRKKHQRSKRKSRKQFK